MSNPSLNALPGAVNIATVQLTDDVPEKSQNVIDETPAFVCRNYHDFLNRDPDLPDLVASSSQQLSGLWPRRAG